MRQDCPLGVKVGERYWEAGPFLLYGYINTGRACAIEVVVTEAVEGADIDSAGGEACRSKPVSPDEFKPAHGDMMSSTSQFYRTQSEAIRHQVEMFRELRSKAETEDRDVLPRMDEHIERLEYELSLVEQIEELKKKK